MSAIPKFCTTKHFLIGLSVGLGLLALVIPITLANGADIKDNSVAVAEINTNFNNLDNTLGKLDSSVKKLDDRLDKLTLILCDLSTGKHC